METSITRICKKCKIEKNIVDFYFIKPKNRYKRVCKTCILEQSKNYYYKNQDKVIKRHVEYNNKNKEYLREKQGIYREVNKEKIKIYHQKRYLENKEKYNDNSRKWYYNNWEKRNKEIKEWKSRNPVKPEKIKEYRHARRARVINSEGRFSANEFLELCNKYGNKCLRCNENKPLTADHVIPLARGGSNSIDNIQPLCRSCNAKKHTKTIDYRPKDVV